jgi:serine/threonine-protein kinase
LALSPGTRLGPFEILSPLGKGGMGEVYRARDTHLGREVAIKVLPSELARDPERLARFEREARVLASLNHPNVATLHGFERAADVGFLVMELVEGETLADRIARGPMPWREAAALFESIADGLKAAHESGIVHRDLKPANVKIDREGRPKILDFGLARSAAGDDAAAAGLFSHSPTLTARATVPGMLLGTAAYMSPEQARGLRVDRRADVWAFGCCLYEALSCKRAFEGEDISLTLAAVLSRDPDWERLPAELPRELVTLLRRCLVKDHRQRLQDLGDARWWLTEARRVSGEHGDDRVPVSHRRRRGVFAVAAVAALAAAAAAGWFTATRTGDSQGRPSGAGSTVARFDVTPPRTAVVTQLGRAVAVHPRGTSFVFDGGDSFLRYEIAAGASYPIAGTAGQQPFFSDDGTWLGLISGSEIVKVRVGGGVAQRLGTMQGLPAGATWRGDRIVFGVWGDRGDEPDRGLWSMRATGGTPERLGDHEALAGGTHPSFVEGRDAILFSCPGAGGDGAAQELCFFDLSNGVVHELGIEGRIPQHVNTGHVVFARDDGLWAAAVDLDRVLATSEPRRVLDVESTSLPFAPFATSPNGTLVVVNHDRFDLVEIAADGTRRRLTAPPGQLAQPRHSPDGRFVAYLRGGVDPAQIWIHEIATGRESRIRDAGPLGWPVWTPDGRLVYENVSSSRHRLRIVTPFGSDEPSTLFEHAHRIFPYTVSPGGVLLFSSGDDWRTNSLWRLDLSRRESAEVWSTETSHQAAFSPDGRWVAYTDMATAQVYVRPYPGPGGGRPASVDGGQAPAWSADGRTLYFASLKGDLLTAVDVRFVEDDLELGAAHVVGELRSDPWEPGYDPKPDGGGFIAVERRDASFTVVVNLGEELRDHEQGAGRSP